MEEGFHRLADGADDVAVSVRKAGTAINGAFSKLNVNKAVANAEAQLRSLERQFEAISAEYSDALNFDDNKAAERLGEKRTKVYDQIARARDKLAIEVAAAAEKEAAAEEKASQKAVVAAQKEAEAKKQAMVSQFDGMGNAADRFDSRLRGIVSSALIFNILSSGLRRVTSYFGSALMANNEFATAVYRLQGSLMVAFQPIYESVLPSLVALINWLNVAVQAVARFFSVLAGKSYKQVQQNAAALNDVSSSANKTTGSVDSAGDAIKDTGQKAKEAEKYLAGFDEINRLLRKDSDDLSDSLGNLGDSIGSGGYDPGDFKGPIFDEGQLPTEWETAIDKLAMRFKDIFFEWDDLNAENILEKLLTGLTALAGGLIGFVLGGPGGAVIGVIVGAGLGVILSSLIFDGDGKLSVEELLRTLVAALGVIAGVLVAFKLGGPGGAAIGAAVGVGLTLLLVSWCFDGDGKLSEDELANTLIVVLAAAVGFIVFSASGMGAGLLAATAGVALGFVIKTFAFNNDGELSESELLLSLVAAMGTVGAAIAFFALGTGGAAAIGAVVGVALAFTITSIVFNGDGKLDSKELIQSLCIALGAIFGGAIGFFIGNGILPGAGGAIGGAAGAAIGATIGLALSFSLLNVEFGEVESEYDNLNKKVGQWSDETTQTTEDRYIQPTSTGFKNLQKEMSTSIEQTKDDVVSSMDLAATGVDTTFFEPMAKKSTQLAEKLKSDNEQASERIADSYKIMADDMESNTVEPMKNQFTEVSDHIVDRFKVAKEKVQEMYRTLPEWFRTEVTVPIKSNFDEVMEGINNRLIEVSNTVNSAVEQMRRSYNEIIATYNAGIQQMSSALASAKRRTSSASATSVSNVSYTNITYPTAEVPMLARGAVIPPNQKFLAVLGDQRHGTNIEAPLATIQEAVELAMADMVPAMVAGLEAVIQRQDRILEAVENIEIDGETLNNAISGYRRKMNMATGQPLPW